MSTTTVFYHASHADLPAGTVLNAPVFLSTDLLDSHDWGHLLGNPHVYEVTPTAPVETRYQKDALSDEEHVTASAVIVRKVGTLLDMDRNDYCDGCIPGI